MLNRIVFYLNECRNYSYVIWLVARVLSLDYYRLKTLLTCFWLRLTGPGPTRCERSLYSVGALVASPAYICHIREL